MTDLTCQVAVIGGGPGGLSAATRLKELGLQRIMVIEREPQAGGIPRHCGHSAFGMREYKRLLSGAAYAGRLVSQALNHGVEIRLSTTVTACAPGGTLTLSSPDGIQTLQAGKIILATGNRETPRSARLVSGSRPIGIVTTGALQSTVYLKGLRPFTRPVIIGSELIAFSALLTCRHANIQPVAMIEANSRPTLWKAATLLPRLMGVPVYLNATIRSIHGRENVEAVEINHGMNNKQTIECDGVIFSGQFVSESSLIRASHLELDARSGGPRVDQYSRCSDPDYYACGNVMHPVDTAGWCWAEGRKVAAHVFAGLAGKIPETHRHISINTRDDAIKYFTPQRLALANPSLPPAQNGPEAHALQLRFNAHHRGRLCLVDGGGGTALITKKLLAKPEKRYLLPLPGHDSIENCESLSLQFTG